MDLTNEDVADILALLDSLPYDSLDVETPRFRLTLRRAPGGGWTQESRVLAEPTLVTPSPERRLPALPPAPRGSAERDVAAAAAGQRPRTARAATAGTGQHGQPGDGGDGLAVVAAPLPGTFYRAPRPGADPFVQVGDEVVPDTVVAIVETMKLMNSVHAGTTGRVARITVDTANSPRSAPR